MNRFYIISLLFVIATYVLPARGQDNQQPKMKYQVYVNGEQYNVVEGDTLKTGDDKIVIKSSDYLTFDFGVLRFDYPKHFAYEFEEDFSYKNWTLDGNSFVISYFEFGAELKLEDFVKELVKKFGKRNCKQTDKQVKLGNVEMSGTRLDVSLLGASLTYDIYHVVTDDYKTHFISFQDTKNDDGSDSKEGIEALKVINETFKVK